MRILVTGAQGQIGWELQQCLPALGDVVAVDLAECDLTQPAQVSNLIRSVKPDLIVNTAAHTAVDRAEAEPALAQTLNADVPAQLADEARRLGAALIHYSTDYVYDGMKSGPYVESDPVKPLSTYGRTKLAGEQAVAAAGIPHLILRTSWVYGMRGSNFLLTMMRLAATRTELRVVADQHGVPNWSHALAEATAAIIGTAQQRGGMRAAFTANGGVYHLTCRGATTWHGFATAIIERLADNGAAPRLRVTPITTAEYPTAAMRPANSVLDGGRLECDWSVTLPHWQAAFDQCLPPRAHG